MPSRQHWEGNSDHFDCFPSVSAESFILPGSTHFLREKNYFAAFTIFETLIFIDGLMVKDK